MTHTNYHNASGLPDDRQITTARDQAILARALQDRFPNYFHYFSTRQLRLSRPRRCAITTTCSAASTASTASRPAISTNSGFNIAVDVRRHHRHLVVVVFGGRTARARDARVRKPDRPQHQGRRDQAHRPAGGRGLDRQDQARQRAAFAEPRAAPAGRDIARAGFHRADQADPGARPCWCSPATMHTASLSPLPLDPRKLKPPPATAKKPTVTTVATVKPTAAATGQARGSRRPFGARPHRRRRARHRPPMSPPRRAAAG